MPESRDAYRWVLTMLRDLMAEPIDQTWIYLGAGQGLVQDLQEVTLPGYGEPESQGLPGRVSRTGGAVFCRDVREDRDFGQFYRPVFASTRAQWCVPLFVSECILPGDARPVLCLEWNLPRPADPRLERGLELLGFVAGLRRAALAGNEKVAAARSSGDEIERWSLEQQVQRLADVRPEPTIRRLLQLALSFFGAQGMTLWQYDPSEDSFCRPLFAPGCPSEYRNYPPPGSWGPVGKAISSAESRFVSDVGVEPDLKVSRFMTGMGITSTAYVPVGGATDSARGILFGNYSAVHEFHEFERQALQRLASAAIDMLEARSRARRHRLSAKFELSEEPDYPGVSHSAKEAVESVLRVLGSRLAFEHVIVYLRARPGSLFVRYAWSSPAGEGFEGRYLESDPLPDYLRSMRREIVDVRDISGKLPLVEIPEALRKGRCLTFRLLRGGELLGFCLLATPEPQAEDPPPEAVQLFQRTLGTLLELDQQAKSQARHVALLGRFLRIYEYATAETSPVSLLSAYLDALLEGTTADACYVYLDDASGVPRLRVARGDVPPSTDEPLPEDLMMALNGGEASFVAAPLPASVRGGRSLALLPIEFRRSRLGVLRVEYETDHLFTEEDKWFFKVLVHQLGQSLHFFSDNQVLLERVSSLAASGARIAGLGSPEYKSGVQVDRELVALVEQAKVFARADFVELFVLEGGALVLQKREGGIQGESLADDDSRVPAGGVMARACRERRPIRIADVRSDEGRELGFLYNPHLPDARSELAVPVLDQEEVVAVINLESRRPGAFSEGDAHFVQAIAAQAVALRRVAELQQARRQVRQERDLLVEVNQIAQQAARLGPVEVLQKIVNTLKHYTGAAFHSIHLLSEDRYALDAARSVASPPAEDFMRRVRLDNSIVGEALRRAKDSQGGEGQVFIPDVRYPPAGYPPALRSGGQETLAKLLVPFGQGPDVVGVINLEHPDAAALEGQAELVKAVAHGVSNALALADYTNSEAGQWLRQMLARESDALLRLLASTVFHDAPTLVETLKLNLKALEEAFDLPAVDRERVRAEARRRIWPSLQRLERLSKFLPKDMRADRMDLGSVLQRTFDEVYLPALPYYEGASSCDVAIEVAATPLYVHAPENYVQLVLEDLAINSFRAMRSTEAARPRLWARAFTDGRTAVAQVEDNGPGIPPEIALRLGQERIEHLGAPGRELGIFHVVAPKLLASHNGTLQLVRNEPGLGCCFELRFPIHEGG